jgi:inosine-uridine nucleoside N-ribohydrolase/formylmethanofuran dehydrogenase subunit E
MRKIVISIALLLKVFCLLSQPLPARLTHAIIIDTDGAIDDMRAISYLLARPEITIRAVLLSDGSLPPAESAGKTASLLSSFNIRNIPMGCGPVLKGINPPWRQFNMQISWGKETGSPDLSKSAAECLRESLKPGAEKVILVCLGPLTNIAQFLKSDADLMKQVERIIWYNESVNPAKGFNYECDRESAESVIRSGVRIDVISNLGKSDALFDSSLYARCSMSKTQLANVLCSVHSQEAVMERMQQNHFRLSDDLVSIYLTNPELFSINTRTDRLNLRYTSDYDLQGIKEALGDMINGIYSTGGNIVFSRFPEQRELFRYDVRPIIDSAIKRYGYDEWKANVMTDEFHGHLGVFSIVGAKMGIRARELFGAGPDMLDVVTYAGSKPPYSCLNDGLQVSTGATLGMGTIHLAADSVPRPSAVFTYRDRSVRISLKKEYLDKVDADINEGILKFGLMDDGYWKLIRHNALKYWLEWDRKQIFDIEETDNK